MIRSILSQAIVGVAILLWVGPIAMAIFDGVTWMVGFGPVSSVDWFDGDRKGALFFWTMFGWLPTAPLVLLAAWVGRWQ